MQLNLLHARIIFYILPSTSQSALENDGRSQYVKSDRSSCPSRDFRYPGEVNHLDPRTWANGQSKPLKNGAVGDFSFFGKWRIAQRTAKRA